MSKKVLTGIILGVLAVAVIIAMILTLPGLLNRQALTKNIESKTIPVFSKNVGVIDGWRVNVVPAAKNSYGTLTKTNVITMQPNGTKVTSPTSKFCQINAQTNFLPSYQAGAGDFYLSKNALYTQAQGAQVILKKEGTVWVKSNAGDVEFATGTYSSRIQTAPIKKGESAVTTPVTVMVAARAVDKLYANGTQSAPAGQVVQGLYGSDPKKGVPVLSVTYSCYGKTPSAAEFNRILTKLTAQV